MVDNSSNLAHWRWMAKGIRGQADSRQVAQVVNAGLVSLYWHIGHRIRQEILGESRAAYGERIVDALSEQLTAEYGRGSTRTNLFHMIRFAEVFPDERIVYALRRQLTEEYGRGFSRRNLFNMVRFAEVFPDEQIVQSVIAQLS